MPKKHRGRPIITLRLSTWQIAGLKLIASRGNTTVSDLIREMIDAYLWMHNIRGPEPEQIDGQVTSNDLIDA